MTLRPLSDLIGYLFPFLPPSASRRYCGGNLSNGRRSGSGLSNGSRGSTGLTGGCAAGGIPATGSGSAGRGSAGGRGSGLSKIRIGGDGASDGVNVEAVLDPFFLGRMKSPPLVTKRARKTKKKRRTTMITIVLYSFTILAESRIRFSRHSWRLMQLDKCVYIHIY